MEIRVLGPGCPNCETLFARTKEAIAELGIEADIRKVQKLDEILAHGVMMTPALVVDGEVKFAGRVPRAAEIASMLGGGAAAK
ncbi:MAG: thioredoxin family protein [Candidatus Eisenbacteria bacterium]